MAVYTVHEPPPRQGRPASDPTRFAFVRDGFHFWAFLFAPLWMLWHRLWLVLIGYVVLALTLQAGLAAVGADETTRVVAGILLALLVGFEAASLRRSTLSRHRWRDLGVVVADDLEAAERRFFDRWATEGTRPTTPSGRSGAGAAVTPPRPPSVPSGPSPDVIGLFPQPGGPP